MIRAMFRTAKNKKYNFKPLYYDKDQEDFERRVKRAARQSGTDDLKSMERLVRLSDKFQDRQSDHVFFRQVRHQKSMARLRFLIIINILLIIVIFAIWKLL